MTGSERWRELREALERLPAGRTLAIDRLLSGRYLGPRPGESYLAERSLSPHHYHAGRHLSDALGQPVGLLGPLVRQDELAGLNLEDLLFLDTETTGLSLGAGTLVFLVGTGRFEAGRFVVRQFFLADPAGEAPLLEAVLDHLGPAAGLVTFNGRQFDLPQLESRLIMARLNPSLPRLPHLDLLPLARRVWGLKLESRSLASLEDNVLGYVREGDVPGYLVPSLYRQYLRTGDARDVEPVFEHNLCDLLSMVLLACRLREWAAGAAEGLAPADAHPLEVVGLARACELAGLGREGTTCYEAALARGLHGSHQALARERLGFLYKRLGHREEAASVWRQAVAGGPGSLTPYVELAKHYEHFRGDYAAACSLVEEALRRDGLSPGQEAALCHRLARLRRRLGMNGASPA